MEILNKIPITNYFLNPAIVVLIVLGFGFLAVLGLIFSYAPSDTIRDKICMPIILIGSIGMILSFFICCIINFTVSGEPTGRYKYEVKISDSTTFKEVTDNYKIVSNRGEIWVLEDKDA